jgi:hypothetical protein
MNTRSVWRLRYRRHLPIFLLSLSIVWLPSLMTGPVFAATPEELAAEAAEQVEAGSKWFRAGDFQQALQSSQRAAEIYEAAGNREGQIKALR